MLAERIDDRALIRLIKKWLKAGGLDTDGTVRRPATGTRTGASVHPSSPMAMRTVTRYVV